MRDKLRALYYPDFWVNYPTLIKSVLLFDEIHFMDRPSLTFDGKHLAIGMASPIRQYEQWFRDQGMPMYVHEPPSGPVVGELREVSEADVSDLNFMTRFQEGLRTSIHFRNLHIAPGNYGNGETHETIFQRLAAVDLQAAPPLIEVHNNQDIRPYDFTNPEGSLKTLVSLAAFCSAKINFALKVGVAEGFSPLADMAPYSSLLSAKYNRAVASSSLVKGKEITATDLSLAIFDDLVPTELLSTITVDDAIKYRKESEPARDAFLEHLLVLQAKLGQVPADGEYSATIRKIVTTEILPAAREFRNKLDTIYDKLLGKIKGAAVVAAGSPAVVQIFGDITLEKLLFMVVMPAAAYVGAEALQSLTEIHPASRHCALSYLLNLDS